MRSNKITLAILALIATNMIWGAAPPIFKWALSDVHPYTLAFLRFALPPLIMFPFVRKSLQIDRKDFFGIILAGFFGIFINIAFFFAGLLQAPSINSALIASSAPIFIIIYSLIFLKEKLKGRLLAGALIGIFGVLLVLIVPLFKSGSLVAEGNLFFIVAMLGSVIGLLMSRKVLKRNSPTAVTFWTFCVGAVAFIPFFADEVKTYGFLQNINFQGILGILFGVIFSSLIAYFLQNWALKRLTASDVGIFTYIDPVVTILVAAPLLGEFPNAVFVFGSFFVLGGILLAEGRVQWHPLNMLLRS